MTASLLISTVWIGLGAQQVSEGQPQTAGSATRGKALFLGLSPLAGKPRNHSDLMPPAVVRCGNCHGVSAVYEPKVDKDYLLGARQRRGGPLSSYNQVSFCKLLRTGVDPAYIMIDHTMPIYDLPDDDCAGLWAYMLRDKDRHAKY